MSFYFISDYLSNIFALDLLSHHHHLLLFFFFGRSHTPLKLKRWHRVRISRTGLLAEVQVDDKKKVAQLATGAFTQVLTLISILSCSWNLGAYYYKSEICWSIMAKINIFTDFFLHSYSKFIAYLYTYQAIHYCNIFQLFRVLCCNAQWCWSEQRKLVLSLEMLTLRVCNDSNFASDKIKLKEASCNTFHQTYMYLCIWNNPTNLTVSLSQLF